MRAGACTLPQTLTSEAASALKHSLSLARRRGHAQVTPLHVAATLLTSRASVLRRACLKSQPHQSSHPLQCRALELCFNVALNRLPTTPGPLLHGQPSLSNALIAALKRAQAHQRRGCIEQQQQQPLLTVKVELEQLIISILDDPSVSRVMKEAGFSSTSVKNNLEDSSSVSSVFQCYSSSGGIFSSPCSPCPSETLTHQRDNINFSPPGTTFWQTHFLNYSSEQYPLIVSPQKKNPITTTADLAISVKEDLKLVVEVLLRKNKRRNTVLVGDCESLTQGLVSELMGRVERGHYEVPEELKSAQFIKFQFATVSLRFMKREDVELNLSDLKRKVDSLVLGGRGAIIYAGDLKWTVEEVTGHYSPVDHLVSEMASLLSNYSNSDAKVWLMANASYQTYMRCQMKQPPLDVQWSLQAVSVPSGGLGLSLHAPSVNDSKINLSGAPYQVVETKQFSKEEDIDKLICCAECTSNFEKETDFLKSSQKKLLPCWLQLQGPNACQEDEIVEVRRKWNRLCHSIHYGRHNQYLSSSVYTNQSLNIGKSSPYPLLSTHNNSIITPDPNSISFASKPNHQFRRQRSCSSKHLETTSCLNSFNKAGGEKDRDIDITLALGNSVFCGGGEPELSERRKQQNNICKLLQENVPWQAETIPSIVQALEVGSKNGTWLLIQGNDPIGKKRLARAIAEAVFGCAELLFHMNMANSRNNGCEILARALQTHEKLVVLVEDVDSADNQFIKFLADGFATGYSSQAIFILARGDSTGFDVNHPLVLEIEMLVNTTSPATPNLDYKRKAPEWDLPNKTKNPRTEDGSSADIKVFSRRLSTTFDLNIKADENDDNKPAPGELSPISSDLTPEMVVNDLRFPHGFLESIQNRFVFDRHPGCETQITEVFLAKIRGCFEEVYGGEYMGFFSVDRTVLEEMFVNSASFLNSCFDEWVKQVLQTSFQTVKIGGKEGMGVIMLCVGRKCDRFLEDGFIGSNLPKKIQVSFVDS